MSIVRISKINGITHSPQQHINNKKNNNEIAKNQTNPIINSYKDFNINFRGRTPENFYEQDFNVNNMPKEMKKYLYTDYENRKHIPPEQIMNEVFKYISIANNVEDAKELYPNEELFSNLHEASLKNRSGILSDIKLAKELENAPLLKDSDMDFGVYLLNKIYAEGKTIREINKDFYDKDLNPVYKGIITQPITYGTTSAYGIRYPKHDFWNSFIATREEYKKFFVENMPKTEKQIENNKKTNTSTDSAKQSEKKEPAKRKYKIQSYKKRALKDDIKSAKGNKEAIEKAVIKRFTKDDPEASFIVKYLSPIMTIAADRIHLSEEMKDFISVDKQTPHEPDDYMFKRFWKANPFLLEQYSTAITDTIELFEEVYGGGGELGINNKFQIVNKDTQNDIIIDYVPREFKQLLDYAEGIIPAREAKYQKHDELQEAWNKHFLERYGALDITEQVNKETINKIVQKNPNEQLFLLKDANGNQEEIYLDLEKSTAEYFKQLSNSGAPTKLLKLYIKEALSNPLCNELFKLSIALKPYKDKIEDKDILTDDEINEIKFLLDNQFSIKHPDLVEASDFAICEALSKDFNSASLYRYRFGYATHIDNEIFQECLKIKENERDTLQKNIDELYDKYTKPLNNSEQAKLGISLIDYISKFNYTKTFDSKSVLYNQTVFNDFLKIAHDFANNKDYRRDLKSLLIKTASFHPSVKTILNNSPCKELKVAKTEAAIIILLRALFDRTAKLTAKLNQDENAILLAILKELKLSKYVAKI